MSQFSTNKKKIMLLGGSYAQIPAIEKAKEKKLYTVLCDYLPDNPGQDYADEFHEISTTDKEGILKLAKELKIDYIMAYASDPAAPTAAYVSGKLGLPGSSYESVKILSEKDLFREMLNEHDFNTPKSISFTKSEADEVALDSLEFPLIVKPVDSSGSKGVTKIMSSAELKTAAESALKYSRAGRVIAEEYVDNSQADLHGDGLVVDGELTFIHLGDHLYGSKANPFNPTGTIWPSKLGKVIIEKVEQEIAQVVSVSGYKNGLINVEARIDKQGKLYIMEIGARAGGHFVPQAIMHSTGFDLLGATLDAVKGGAIHPEKRYSKKVSYHAIYTDKPGELKAIKFSDEIKPYIKEFNQYNKIGDKVNSFTGASSALGVAILVFDEYTDERAICKNIEKHIMAKVY